MNPYTVVEEFEKRLASWCGSKYAVCVESCTAAIFLCLQYKKALGYKNIEVDCPKFTYPSTPCSIIHSGFKVRFCDFDWEGEYCLHPFDIYDSALRLQKEMYHGGMQCISFHVKKLLPIGRGGAILLDDIIALKWLRLARFDGREPIPLLEQEDFSVLGYNMYMSPSDAARGVQLFEVYKQKYGDGAPDLVMEEQGYADLSKFPIYQQ